MELYLEIIICCNLTPRSVVSEGLAFNCIGILQKKLFFCWARAQNIELVKKPSSRLVYIFQRYTEWRWEEPLKNRTIAASYTGV
jgi:hypothetical protein